MPVCFLGIMIVLLVSVLSPFSATHGGLTNSSCFFFFFFFLEDLNSNTLTHTGRSTLALFPLCS